VRNGPFWVEEEYRLIRHEEFFLVTGGGNVWPPRVQHTSRDSQELVSIGHDCDVKKMIRTAVDRTEQIVGD